MVYHYIPLVNKVEFVELRSSIKKYHHSDEKTIRETDVWSVIIKRILYLTIMVFNRFIWITPRKSKEDPNLFPSHFRMTVF